MSEPTTTDAPPAPDMPGDEEATTAIARRAEDTYAGLSLPAPLMSDDEIRRAWRLAGALAQSGMSKNTRQAEQAFGKILIGRDLGISATRAMMGLDFVEGQVQMRGVLLGSFIRERPGYDYRQAWIKQDGETRVAVYVDEDSAADMREIVGVAVEFFVDGKLRGLSTFTREDADAAHLGNKPTYQAHPRNMWLWRALSNGVKWFVPEIMGGIPVYVEGEIPTRPALTDGSGSGEQQGIDFGPKVEAVMQRAERLGHAGFSDRATVEMTLGAQPPGVVDQWVAHATSELDAMEAGEPVPEEVVTGEVMTPAETQALDDVAAVEKAEGLREQALGMLDDADAADELGDADRAAALRGEAGELNDEADRLSPPNPDQSTLGDL